jgi:hypothetical protein
MESGQGQNWKANMPWQKKIIKFEDKFFPGHICGCVSFENGKRANPIFKMVKLRSPVFIMTQSPFSPSISHPNQVKTTIAGAFYSLRKKVKSIFNLRDSVYVSILPIVVKKYAKEHLQEFFFKK